MNIINALSIQPRCLYSCLSAREDEAGGDSVVPWFPAGTGILDGPEGKLPLGMSLTDPV